MKRQKVCLMALITPLVMILPWYSVAGEDADAVFFNGKIFTADHRLHVVSAVAVKDGKILATGTDDEMKKLAGGLTRLIDLQGKTVVPGLIDAHTHPMETLYLSSDFVNCRYPGVPSVKQALQNISDSVKTLKPGEWLYAACVSASQTKFAEKRMPTKAELDSVCPNNPLVVADGAHLSVVNTKALEALGVTRGMTRLPKGGGIVLDSEGNPTGTITDAMGDLPPKLTADQIGSFYKTGIQEFWNSYGFTSLLAITPATALPVLQNIAAGGYKPTVRYSVAVWLAPDGEDMPEDLSAFRFPAGSNPDFYRFIAIKAWIDGENDARTGLMCDPYIGHKETDPAGGKGSEVTSQQQAEKLAAIAQKNNVICMLHCSGDKAIDIGLTTYENLCTRGNPDQLFRIEHFGMFQMYERQLDQAVKLYNKGLRISVQPTWLTVLAKSDIADMGYDRASTGFLFRSMIAAGLQPAASTDVTGIYLDNANPMKAIHASVTRRSDAGIFGPEQAVTVEEALLMWTIWAARSMGEGDIKGSLEPGKFADMTVLSDDILTIDPAKILDITIEQTIVGGEIVYHKK